MSLIDKLIKTPQVNAPKGILYAGAGVGKTTFIANAQSSVIVDCENGAGLVDCVRTPYLETWPEIEKWLIDIEANVKASGYGVVAIDTIDWLIRRMEEHVSGCKTNLTQTLGKAHGGYGNGKQVLKNYIHGWLLPCFDRLVNKGVAVVMLAHARRIEFVNEDGATVEKTCPDLHQDFLNALVEWSDFVCMAVKNPNGSRKIITTETAQALAKNRYGMPSEIAFTWEEFTTQISNGINAKIGQQKKEKK